MVFAAPAMLWISAAVAAPVLIHLLMRSRPRKVIFPAMRFVMASRHANIRMLNLRHLILLLLRMLGIFLAAMLLAGAAIFGTSGGDSSLPLASVVIIDNSASMNYKSLATGQTPLSVARRQAEKLISSLPPASRVAIVASSEGTAATGFAATLDVAKRQAGDVVPGYGGETLSQSMSSATAMLRNVDLSDKAIYIFTDMTAHAWQDVSCDLEGRQIGCRVVDCGWRGNSNVAVAPPTFADGIVADGMDVLAGSSVSASAMAGQFQLFTRLDGVDIDSRALQLRAGQTVGVSVAIPVRGPGVWQGQMAVNSNDSLECDNVRYFTFHGSNHPNLLTVRDAAARREVNAEFLMTSAISPPTSGAGLAKVYGISADRLNAAAVAAADVILLADVSALADDQWRMLEAAVREGKKLWIVAGKLMSINSYNSPSAARVFPAELGSLVYRDAPWKFAGMNLRHPMTSPFSGRDNPPLSAVDVMGRFDVRAVRPDCDVVLKYSDGVPAIMLRDLGRGEVLFWNFSPTGDLSNLVSLRQFVVLAQRAFRLLAFDDSDRALSAYWGRSVRIVPPAGFHPKSATIRTPSGDQRPVRYDASSGGVDVFADELGNWIVSFFDGKDTYQRGFSVNVDPAESDLSAIAPVGIEKCFPPGGVETSSDVSGLLQTRKVKNTTDLAVVILLSLLAVLLAESMLSNRFYKADKDDLKIWD